MINKKRLIKLTQDLIRIDSQNPPGNESRIAEFVSSYLRSFGVKSKIYEFKKNRSNVVARLGAGKNRRSLLISPHLDTVPVGKNWSVPAFSARISANKIYGLGATDCKANIACALEAMHSLIEAKRSLGYNLIFAATADEESGSDYGLVPLLDRGILRPDMAVVLDSDDFEIIVAQKGLMHLKVKIEGKRAHGAYPWLGINAIDAAVDIIHGLRRLKLPFIRHRYLRPPTMNIGTIRGGDKVNVVADWCEVELDFRFLPGMSDRKILKELNKVIRSRTRRFKIQIQGIQKPYLIDKNHRLVDCLARAIKKSGARPAIKGSEGATVISFFQAKDIPAVATGFGSGGTAHAADEYVKIDNLCKGAVALEEFLKSYRC
jgi:acetylornithine deacetylase/succinyl-diaminopimelate desuccinylase family protein